MKKLFILVCAFNPSNKLVTAFGERRVRQYVAGLERVVDLSEKFPDFDYVLVDNTITPEWKIPEQLKNIIEKIPNLTTVFFNDNDLPSKNKGCGVIMAWKKALSEIDVNKYDYCIHFEPRQHLKDFSFFDNFIKNPDSYFKILKARVLPLNRGFLIRYFFIFFHLYRKQYWTGLFSIKREIFNNYIKEVDLIEMAEKKICLEDDMFKRISTKHIKPIDHLGLVWHDAFSDNYIEY